MREMYLLYPQKQTKYHETSRFSLKIFGRWFHKHFLVMTFLRMACEAALIFFCIGDCWFFYAVETGEMFIFVYLVSAVLF